MDIWTVNVIVAQKQVKVANLQKQLGEAQEEAERLVKEQEVYLGMARKARDRFEAMQSFQTIHDLSAKDSLSEEDLMLWRRKAVEHMFHYACTGFHVVPKFHLLQHLPQHIRRSGVPKTFWV